MHADLPAHLSGTRAAGLSEPSPVAQHEFGTFRNFTYFVLDWERRVAVVIDPHFGADEALPRSLSELRKKGFSLERILLTHTHWDHIDGIEKTLETWPGIELLVHRDEAHRLSKRDLSRARVGHFSDGGRLAVGSHELLVVHTPGHSAGECCFLLGYPGKGPVLFSGDTLFVRNCGNTHQETGDTRRMFESLQRLKRLPRETIVLPGHHYTPECATTIGRELAQNPALLCSSVEELDALP